MDSNTASSSSSTLLSQIMIGSMVLTLTVLALLFILHVYTKWYWSTSEDPGVVDWRRRQAAAAKPRGLDASALKSLPVVSYDPKDFKDELECAVCLSELTQGEKTRVLPKCNHGFHLECIDVWFKSHSTCPLCRTLVVDMQENPDVDSNNVDDLHEEMANVSTSSDGGENGRPRNPAFPTNVLFWGDDTEVSSTSVSASTSRGVEMVIEVPAEHCEDGLCSDEGRSPIMTKLRSLKRLLSRGKRVTGSSSSSAHDQV